LRAVTDAVRFVDPDPLDFLVAADLADPPPAVVA
jgi:hypothetical protein